MNKAGSVKAQRSGREAGTGANSTPAITALSPMMEHGRDTMPCQNTVQIRTPAPYYYWDCDRCGRCPCACQFKI